MDLKEFLDSWGTTTTPSELHFIREKRYRLGLFFWDRGGKQFALNHKSTTFFDALLSLADGAKEERSFTKNMKYKLIDANIAQDFLDCLDCLGKDKVKELIKECERINES